MKLVSFDALRTLHFPRHSVLKPEHYLTHQATLTEADWVLFPPYWLLNSLVFGLHTRIFPSLASYLIGHNKIEMTRAFQLVTPDNTPYTEILTNTPANQEWLWASMDTPFVAKIVKSSMGEGVVLVEDKTQWRHYCQTAEVLYVQEYLPIDRDLRIIVAGNDIIAGYWRMQSPYSFHNNISRGGEIVEGIVPPAAEALVRKVSAQLGINHAGFDVAMVGTHPYLLEFNRLFGTRGLYNRDIELATTIVNYLQQQLEDDSPTRPRSPTGRGPKIVANPQIR